jgi:hypothetical protein
MAKDSEPNGSKHSLNLVCNLSSIRSFVSYRANTHSHTHKHSLSLSLSLSLTHTHTHTRTRTHGHHAKLDKIYSRDLETDISADKQKSKTCVITKRPFTLGIKE